jgi:hypothetical protein
LFFQPDNLHPSEGESCAAATVSDNSIKTSKLSGRVVASGVTVQGFETKFMEEVEFGDTILVHHPTSLIVSFLLFILKCAVIQKEFLYKMIF